ncbi:MULTISPECIES: PucR family transcriptional regulator [unclassified Rhodococcus (in: high G+C Gram-positive bacteria)]|uniref:PucR family transcriptional regulator n=1 Tax=unclassified Rhodococcus (in: high G+C Gram-positive bacteria) TaxID=192944 RepID=UPI0029538DAE|nr:helix-turn-helix domain-containing protein [Rhodococcus sp. IEGM 1343]MDV8054655.1 PucR family transcriptional regulator ligand-binding domain-containing protein [Rhodococcus sp. IEGM 1343]
MRLRDLADLPDLKLQPIVTPEHFDPTIRWVVTTDMLDPSRYLSGGELVLTGLMWRTGPEDSRTFVRAVSKAGISALAASDDGVVPDDLVDACLEHGLPLFRVPADIAFATVTESVVRQLSTARASDLSLVLDRHRRLVASAGPGGGLGPLLEMVSSDLGMNCWVVTSSGRVLAGSDNPPDTEAVAQDFMSSVRLPRYCPEQRVSVFAVDGESAPRVVDWFVAFESDWQTWDAPRLSLAGQLASIVAVERSRVDDRLSGSGILAQEFVRTIVGGATAADILAQMHVIGLDIETRYAAVAVATSGETLRLGELRPLLREVLAPLEITLGIVDGEAIALVEARTDRTDSVRRAVHTLAPGLVGSGTSIGVSAPTAPADIRSAIEEARYARRLAERRGSDCSVVGHDELATLTILLANVPDDVRRMFTSRLLTPLVDYDDLHNSDLVETLSVYLDTNGAWTRCAEQLHMHVNSVRYRIQRIEELTGRDLSRLEDRIEFYLALRLR